MTDLSLNLLWTLAWYRFWWESHSLSWTQSGQRSHLSVREPQYVSWSDISLAVFPVPQYLQIRVRIEHSVFYKESKKKIEKNGKMHIFIPPHSKSFWRDHSIWHSSPHIWNTLGLPLGTGANESKSTKSGRRRDESATFLLKRFKCYVAAIPSLQTHAYVTAVRLLTVAIDQFW